MRHFEPLTQLRAPSIRCRVDPRDIPPSQAARLLGMTVAEFDATLPRLQLRGFPAPDPDTGRCDRKAVEAWMDGRSALTGGSEVRDPSAMVRNRIARMRGG